MHKAILVPAHDFARQKRRVTIPWPGIRPRGSILFPLGAGQVSPDSPKAHTPDCSALWGWVPGETFRPCLLTRGQSARLRQRSPRWNKITALWSRRFKGATINTLVQSTGTGGCCPSAQSSPSRRAQRVNESMERKQVSWVLLPRQKSSWPAHHLHPPLLRDQAGSPLERRRAGGSWRLRRGTRHMRHF